MANNLNYTEPGSGSVIAFRDEAGDDSGPFHQRCDVQGNLAHDAAAASLLPVLTGGYASAAAPSDVSADNDAVRAWFLRNGAQACVVTAAGALVGGDATNGLDVDVTRVPTDPFGANADSASATGSISAKLRFIASTGIPITGTVTVGSHAVTNVGTFAVQVDGAALTALQLLDDAVFADEAAFTLATSKVLATGGYSVAHGSAPDALAAGGVGIPVMNRHRVPFTIGGHPNVVTLKHANITTAVTDTAIIASISAGTKVVVTRLTVTLDNASTVFPTVLVGFGATNTPTTTGVIAAHGGVPAGGGFTIGDGSGMIGVGGDGEELRITTTGNATGNGLQVTVSYYLIES